MKKQILFAVTTLAALLTSAPIAQATPSKSAWETVKKTNWFTALSEPRQQQCEHLLMSEASLTSGKMLAVLNKHLSEDAAEKAVSSLLSGKNKELWMADDSGTRERAAAAHAKHHEAIAKRGVAVPPKKPAAAAAAAAGAGAEGSAPARRRSTRTASESDEEMLSFTPESHRSNLGADEAEADDERSAPASHHSTMESPGTARGYASQPFREG